MEYACERDRKNSGVLWFITFSTCQSCKHAVLGAYWLLLDCHCKQPPKVHNLFLGGYLFEAWVSFHLSLPCPEKWRKISSTVLWPFFGLRESSVLLWLVCFVFVSHSAAAPRSWGTDHPLIEDYYYSTHFLRQWADIMTLSHFWESYLSCPSGGVWWCSVTVSNYAALNELAGVAILWNFHTIYPETVCNFRLPNTTATIRDDLNVLRYTILNLGILGIAPCM